MEELFNNILDQDEKIIKVFKPHKGKLYFSTLFCFGLMWLFLLSFSILGILFPEEGVNKDPILVLIPIGVFVLFMLLTWLFTAIYYKNLYFAYSNKRVIIRSGIFGVDYRSLDMGMIGAVNVYVSLFDKIIHKNTGSISFGSTASPMISSKGGSSYNFSHIVLPYETCKEIKFYIDEFKNKKHNNKDEK